MVSSVVLFSVLLGIVSCSPLGQLAYKSDVSEGHQLGIIAGTGVLIKRAPFIVAIVVDGSIWGSGVVLNENWVLTTAFNTFDLRDVELRVGSNKWQSPLQAVKVQNYTVHPNYTGGWTNNVAVLKTATPLTLVNNKVAVIPLATAALAAGEIGAVTGWGETTARGSLATQLQLVQNTVLDSDACTAAYADIDSSVFCAVTAAEGPCAYDFGAPLVMPVKQSTAYTLYGLYAGGNNCTSQPRLYVNIAQLNAWIQAAIQS